jgi:hypothetical protein
MGSASRNVDTREIQELIEVNARVSLILLAPQFHFKNYW